MSTGYKRDLEQEKTALFKAESALSTLEMVYGESFLKEEFPQLLEILEMLKADDKIDKKLGEEYWEMMSKFEDEDEEEIDGMEALKSLEDKATSALQSQKSKISP